MGYLKKVYNQSNTTQRFQLELKLGHRIQGSMPIQESYSSFENLWTWMHWYCICKSSYRRTHCYPKWLASVINFLMKLRGELEPPRSNVQPNEQRSSSSIDYLYKRASQGRTMVHYTLSWSRKLKFLLPFMLPILLKGSQKEAFTCVVFTVPHCRGHGWQPNTFNPQPDLRVCPVD